MIQKKRTGAGTILTLAPFSLPNENTPCRIVAEISSRRDARLRITDLRTLTIADTAILMNNLRAMVDRVHKEMGLAQRRATKKATKKTQRKR